MTGLSKIDRFAVLDKIADGSFGAVHLGNDEAADRRVVIKLCTVEDQALRQRFFTEAEMAAKLRHRHIVEVLAAGIHVDVPYQVQEHLEGDDLAEVIAERRPWRGTDKLKVLLHVAQGMAYAHSQGISHLDLKPSNVRISGGIAKVMDFGTSRLASSETRSTQRGVTLATASYLPPEQVRSGQLDHRVDVFAFGALAYELFTYQRPFRGQTLSALVYQILYKDPVPMASVWPECPAPLGKLLTTCLAKDRELRYAGFPQLLSVLQGLHKEAAAGKHPALTAAVSALPSLDDPEDVMSQSMVTRTAASVGGNKVTSAAATQRIQMTPALSPETPQPGAPQPGAPQPGAPQPGAPQPGAPQPPVGAATIRRPVLEVPDAADDSEETESATVILSKVADSEVSEAGVPPRPTVGATTRTSQPALESAAVEPTPPSPPVVPKEPPKEARATSTRRAESSRGAAIDTRPTHQPPSPAPAGTSPPVGTSPVVPSPPAMAAPPMPPAAAVPAVAAKPPVASPPEASLAKKAAPEVPPGPPGPPGPPEASVPMTPSGAAQAKIPPTGASPGGGPAPMTGRPGSSAGVPVPDALSEDATVIKPATAVEASNPGAPSPGVEKKLNTGKLALSAQEISALVAEGKLEEAQQHLLAMQAASAPGAASELPTATLNAGKSSEATKPEVKSPPTSPPPVTLRKDPTGEALPNLPPVGSAAAPVASKLSGKAPLPAMPTTKTAPGPGSPPPADQHLKSSPPKVAVPPASPPAAAPAQKTLERSPAPTTRGTAKKGKSMMLLAGLGLVGLVLMATAAWWFLGREESEPTVTAEVIPQPRPQPTGPAAPAVATGRVQVDASPWGSLTEITDDSGYVIELPLDTETPLVLDLPQGTYNLVLSGGLEGTVSTPGDAPAAEQDASDWGELQSCEVEVSEGGLAICRVSFEKPSVTDYFKEAGWWQ